MWPPRYFRFSARAYITTVLQVCFTPKKRKSCDHCAIARSGPLVLQKSISGPLAESIAEHQSSQSWWGLKGSKGPSTGFSLL